jgi:hypothetical protein
MIDNTFNRVMIDNKLTLDGKPNIRHINGIVNHYYENYIPNERKKEYNVNYRRLDVISKYDHLDYLVKVRDSEIYLINRSLQRNGYKHLLPTKNKQ